ncbi:uncharacterized protein LOC116677864 [Tachysurus ichikawai]
MEANKCAMGNIRADKRNYLEALAADAEEAADHGNMRDLYVTIKKLSEKYSITERPVRDKEGKTIPGKDGQKGRCVEATKQLRTGKATECRDSLTHLDTTGKAVPGSKYLARS